MRLTSLIFCWELCCLPLLLTDLLSGSSENVNGIILKCLHVILLLDCDSKSRLWVFLCLMSVQEYFQQGFCFPVFSFQGHSLILTCVWERSSYTKGVSWNYGQGFKHPCNSGRLQFSTLELAVWKCSLKNLVRLPKQFASKEQGIFRVESWI